ncbi:MAG: D-aminoacyl-tRNA deacylase [Candidatus Hecatellaceae archaeon]
MVFLLAASGKDPAALNIVENLLSLHPFKPEKAKGNLEIHEAGNVKLAILEGEAVKAENLDEVFPEAEAVAFASRHESESLQATLTVHVPGNLTGKAAHGGKPRQLAYAWPQRMRLALEVLSRLAPEGFKVSLEATHHGPTGLKKPVWFVEIGSSLEQWTNREAGRAVAEALWVSLTGLPEGTAAVGFGGGHYAPKHSKVTLEGRYVIGHIFPKYALASGLDRELIAQAFHKTYGGCSVAVVDWKGLQGEVRRNLLSLLEGLEVEEVVRV